MSLLDPILESSRDELEALQLERLRATLRLAYEHNSHYTKKFDAAGLRPDHLKTLDDLARFPFTVKADLREAYPFGFFAVPTSAIARIHASSGTTGKPTVVGYTRNDLSTWANLVARSIRAAGGRAGMKVHISYGYGLFGAEPRGEGMRSEIEDHFLPEIIDPMTGTVLAAGETGEAVAAQSSRRNSNTGGSATGFGRTRALNCRRCSRGQAQRYDWNIRRHPGGCQRRTTPVGRQGGACQGSPVDPNGLGRRVPR